MPTWCLNRLNVSGPAPAIRRFCKAMAGVPAWPARAADDPITASTLPEQRFSLNALAPVPPAELQGSWDALCKWQKKQWGCAGDAAPHVMIRRGATGCEIDFETVWSPPIGWLSTVAKQYPELVFFLHYLVPGDISEGGRAFGERGEVSQFEPMHEPDLEWLDREVFGDVRWMGRRRRRRGMTRPRRARGRRGGARRPHPDQLLLPVCVAFDAPG